jgi:hypothetical protein
MARGDGDLNEKSAQEGLRRRCCGNQDVIPHGWSRGRKPRPRDGCRLNIVGLDRDLVSGRDRGSECSERNGRDSAAGAFARRNIGDLRIRLLPGVHHHHRAVVATTVTGHRQLRTAICERHKGRPKQHECKQCSDEFGQMLHDFTFILILPGYTGL